MTVFRLFWIVLTFTSKPPLQNRRASASHPALPPRTFVTVIFRVQKGRTRHLLTETLKLSPYVMPPNQLSSLTVSGHSRSLSPSALRRSSAVTVFWGLLVLGPTFISISPLQLKLRSIPHPAFGLSVRLTVMSRTHVSGTSGIASKMP